LKFEQETIKAQASELYRVSKEESAGVGELLHVNKNI
jgi:hypothetical protein